MLNFYSLYDTKTDHFHVPFYAYSDPEALSMIRDSVLASSDSPLFKCLDDLKLYSIGCFDAEHGSFEPTLCFVDFDLSSFRKEVRT